MSLHDELYENPTVPEPVIEEPKIRELFNPVIYCLELLEDGVCKTPKEASEVTLLEFQAQDPVEYWKWCSEIADSHLRTEVTALRRREAKSTRARLIRQAIRKVANGETEELSEDEFVEFNKASGWYNYPVATDPARGVKKPLGDCSKDDLTKPIAMFNSIREAAEFEMMLLSEVQRHLTGDQLVRDVFSEERLAALAKLLKK